MASKPFQLSRFWRSEDLRAIAKATQPTLIGLVFTSFVINLLMLTSPLFMLQVYDRVLPSRSMPTLIGLFILATIMIMFLGVLEVLRSRVLTRLGQDLDETLSGRVFQLLLDQGLRHGGDPTQCVRDLDTLRSFASGTALTALFDLPWMGIYVTICFLFHPLMGWAVLAGVGALCFLALLTELSLRSPAERALETASTRRTFAEMVRRNADLVQSLGMRRPMMDRWEHTNIAYRRGNRGSADMAASFGGLMRSFRMLLQSGLLALGAYLVINQEATAGVMLAATILSVRALSPVELLIANWKGFIAARQSLTRLGTALMALPPEGRTVRLPAPRSSLRVTAMTLVAAGREAPIVHDVNFALDAGSALGIIGPSGSGKSSIAKALVGLWPPIRGVIRLDNAELSQWSVDILGHSVGYLPQDVELLPGTIAENIARFATPDLKKLFAAAETAGVSNLILRLPKGYDTLVGDGGVSLSGGQRQRIALARALYDDPFLLVLDEPNSNLDGEGEVALNEAIRAVRARGGIAIIIAHRPSALVAVDKVMILTDGRVQMFGDRDQILPQLAPQPAAAPQPKQPERAYVQAAE
jgi:ATP-binding cassette subfamily C protein PrsD